MSHTTTVETQFLNHDILEAASKHLKLEVQQNSTARLFDGSKHTGTVIKLEGWSYPIIVDATGKVAMDNYNGGWGKIERLNELKQAYALEVTRRELKRQGLRGREVVQADGSIKILVQVGR